MMSADRSLKNGRASRRIMGRLVIASLKVIRARERKRERRALRLAGLVRKANEIGISVGDLEYLLFLEVLDHRKNSPVASGGSNMFYPSSSRFW